MKKSKRMLSLLLTFTLLLSLLAPAGSAVGTQPDAPKTGHYYQLVNKLTGTCLTETDDNTFDPPYDTRILVLDESNGSKNQVWEMSARKSEGQDVFSFISQSTGKALQRTGRADNRVAGTNYVVSNTNTPAAMEQSWILIDAGNGYYRLESRVAAIRYPPAQYLAATDLESEKIPGKLDVTAARLDEQDDAQLWKLVEVEGPPIEKNDVQPIPGYPLDPIEDPELKAPYHYSHVDTGDIQLEGYVDEAIRYITEKQAKGTDWKNLVDQYRNKMDDKANGSKRWKGEFWGKMMRGAVWHYQYTKDEELYEILERTVMDMLSTQEENGRISSYPENDEFVVFDLWNRKYTMLGLEYFYEICKDEEMKEYILSRLCISADHILTKIGPDKGTVLLGELGGICSASILEPFVKLYKMTGYQRYLDFSKYIVDTGCYVGESIFESAYKNEISPYRYTSDPHCYALSSCFEGLAEYVTVTGDEKWMTALQNYVARIIEEEITIVGSGGDNGLRIHALNSPEYWNNSAKEQTNPDITQMQETCTTVTWMKLCEKVLMMTEDAALVDQIEKSLYNALLGAIQGEDAVPNVTDVCQALCWDYFSLLQGTRHNDFGGHIIGVDCCCNASGLSGIGLIPLVQVMNSAQGPVINLYNPGVIKANTPSGKKVTLDMNTNYPIGGNVQIVVTPEMEEAFNLKLRIPGWSEKTSVLINGEAVEGVTPGKYLELNRTWKAGDEIQIIFDMRTRMVDSPQGSKSDAGEYVALVRGPIVLARDARFADGTVTDGSSIKTDAEGYADVTVSNTQSFRNHMEFIVNRTDGTSFRMTDYASAGSTWTQESEYATWLTKAIPLELKENTEYFLYCKGDWNLLSANKEDGNVYRTAQQVDDSLQTWVLEKSGDSYLIKNVGTGKYLYASGTEKGSNVSVDAAEDNGTLWNIEYKNGSQFLLASVSSGLFASGSGSGSNVHLWDSGSSPLQIWEFVEKDKADLGGLEVGTQYTMTCKGDQKLATVDESTGNVYRATAQDDSVLQTWVLEKSGDAYLIKNVGTGQYLNASGNVNGSNIYVDSNTGESALWKIAKRSSTTFAVVSVASGRLFSGSGNDENILLWNDGGSPLQVWTFTEVETPPAPPVTSVTGPEETLVNETFEVTAVTGSEVTGIKLVNETGMKLNLTDLTSTDNGDGSITWTGKLAVGTVGKERTLTLATIGTDGEFTVTDASFTLAVKAPAPEVLSAAIETEGVVNAPITLTVKTDQTVTKLDLYNEYGLKLVALESGYEDEGAVRVWTVTTKIGTKGTRYFYVAAKNKYGDVSERMATNETVIRPIA